MHVRGGKHATLVSLTVILAYSLQLKSDFTEMTPEEQRRIECWNSRGRRVRGEKFTFVALPRNEWIGANA